MDFKTNLNFSFIEVVVLAAQAVKPRPPVPIELWELRYNWLGHPGYVIPVPSLAIRGKTAPGEDIAHFSLRVFIESSDTFSDFASIEKLVTKRVS